jgi:hypothetical protein
VALLQMFSIAVLIAIAALAMPGSGKLKKKEKKREKKKISFFFLSVDFYSVLTMRAFPQSDRCRAHRS